MGSLVWTAAPMLPHSSLSSHVLHERAGDVHIVTSVTLSTCPLDPDFIQKRNLSHLQSDRCGVVIEQHGSARDPTPLRRRFPCALRANWG